MQVVGESGHFELGDLLTLLKTLNAADALIAKARAVILYA
jgi:hypothetical protein